MERTVPRRGSLTDEIAEYLRRKPEGATMREIRNAVRRRLGDAYPDSSIRSAVYSNLVERGGTRFKRLSRDTRRNNRYGLSDT